MQVTSCDCTGFQSCIHLRTRPTSLSTSLLLFYENLPLLTVTLTKPGMLAAVQTRHMVRTSGIIPWFAGHLCLLTLSEAAHGTFGNTQYQYTGFIDNVFKNHLWHSDKALVFGWFSTNALSSAQCSLFVTGY